MLLHCFTPTHVSWHGEQVFESAEALARAAITCVYAIRAGTDWALPADMLTAVKHAMAADEAAGQPSGSDSAGGVVAAEGFKYSEKVARQELDQVCSGQHSDSIRNSLHATLQGRS